MRWQHYASIQKEVSQMIFEMPFLLLIHSRNQEKFLEVGEKHNEDMCTNGTITLIKYLLGHFKESISWHRSI